MKTSRKVVSTALCTGFILAAVPLTCFAGEVDYKTAANPAAIIAKIKGMNLPAMPEAVATELRGDGWKLPKPVQQWLLKRARLFFPNKMVKKFEHALNMSASPQEIRATFPSLYGWMISVLPYYLLPQIAR